MKKTLIALAAVAATSVFAQSSVSITGAIGVNYGEEGGVAQFRNSDAGATNLAFTAVEDLGGGLKAKAYMQHRFDINTGISNATGSRDLQNIYLNLSGGFGSVSYGRILTGSLSGFDAFGEYGASALYGDIEGVGNRHDNTLHYSSPKFGGLGIDLATTVTPVGAEYTYARVTFSSGPFSAAYGTDKNKGNNTASGTNKALGLSYDLKMATVYLINGNDNGVSNTSVGVTVPMGKVTLKASTTTGDTDGITTVGADYALSKKTGLFAAVATKGANANGSYRIGMKTSF